MTTTKATPEYLAELRRLADAATPGPWQDWWENPFYEESGKNGDYKEIRDKSDKVIARVYVGMALNEVLAMADSEYIVAACNAIPALIAHIEKLEKLCDHLSELLPRQCATCNNRIRHGCKLISGLRAESEYCDKWEELLPEIK